MVLLGKILKFAKGVVTILIASTPPLFAQQCTDMTSSIIHRIRAKEYAVQKDLSGVTNPQLIADLMTDKDPEVRELALNCLAEIGGEVAEQTAVSALLDSDEQIQMLATRLLRRHATPSIKSTLIEKYALVPSTLVRYQIAVILGKLDGSKEEIALLLNQESASIARDGLLLAAGQHGDVAAQHEFFNRIKSNDSKQRKELLDDASFLKAQWLVPGLNPLLSDKTPALRIGVDGVPSPQFLRVCDLAVNFIAAQSTAKFSFSVDQRTNYSDESLTEVDRYLQKPREE